MLYVTNQLVGRCRVSGSRYDAPLRFALPDTWQHMCTDHLGRLLLQCESVSSPFDLQGDLGHPIQSPGGEDLNRSYLGYPPVGVSRGRIEGLNAWSTYLQNIKAVFTDWEFSHGSLSFHERPVSHYNLKGHLTSDADEPDFYRSGNPYYFGTVLPLYRVTYSDGSGLSFNSTLAYQPVAGLWKILPQVAQDMTTEALNFTADSITYAYSSLSSHVVDKFVERLSYKVVVSQWSGGVFHRKSIRVLLSFWVQRTPTFLPSGGSIELVHVAPFMCRYQTCVTAEAHGCDPSSSDGVSESSVPSLYSDWSNYSGYGMYETVLDTYATHPQKGIGRSDALLGYEGGNYVVGTHDRTFRGFRSTTLPILPDVYAACFVSSKNAVDEHLEVMKSNHLEALLEVGSFAKLVDLVAALRLLRSRKHVLRSLLDVLADANLTYSFGIAPTISDAKDVAERSQAFRRKYASDFLYGWHTARGKYVLQIPDSLRGEFEGLQLIARSQVELAVNADSYLATLLPVESMGLLPTFSAIWDVIPFSFLVDRLFHFGDYLDDIDHQMLFLALESQPSVHSVTLAYDMPDELLREYDLRRTSDGLNGYKYYDRFALSNLPSLGPTRLPIHGSVGVPDWGTSGSLLFKFWNSK